MLANRLPGYQDNIEKKLKFARPGEDSALKKRSRRRRRVGRDAARRRVERPRTSRSVRVVEQPSFRERLQAAVGPYLEFLGVGSFVLILVLFMMMNREDLRDRIVASSATAGSA